jgi:hypothetical protein
VPANKKGVIPEKLLHSPSHYYSGRFEVTREPSLVGRGIASTITIPENNNDMRTAGSGSLAPLGYYPLDISNPRVLSDMGLAILNQKGKYN